MGSIIDKGIERVEGVREGEMRLKNIQWLMMR